MKNKRSEKVAQVPNCPFCKSKAEIGTISAVSFVRCTNWRCRAKIERWVLGNASTRFSFVKARRHAETQCLKAWSKRSFSCGPVKPVFVTPQDASILGYLSGCDNVPTKLLHLLSAKVRKAVNAERKFMREELGRD